MCAASLSVPLSDLKQVCNTVEPAEFNRLARGFLKIGAGSVSTSESVKLQDQIIIAIYEWFESLGVLTDAQRRLIFDRMRMRSSVMDHRAPLPSICEIIEKECVGDDGQLIPTLPVFVLTIQDHRYVHWTHSGKLLDLETEETIDEMDAPGVTLLTCNVSALYYTRIYPRLQQLRKAHDHGHGHLPDKAASSRPKARRRSGGGRSP